MTSSDSPGAVPPVPPAASPAPPASPAPSSRRSTAAAAGTSGTPGSSAVVTPAGSSAVGTATERIATGDYAGSFGGPDIGGPSFGGPQAPAAGPTARPGVTAQKHPGAAPLVAPAAPAVRLGARRARLTIRRVDPWSVLKFTLLFSICMLIVGVVAVAALYYALDKLQVFDTIHKFVLEQTSNGLGAARTGGFDITFKARWFVGGAAVLGAINTVIFTALATLGAFLYNLCSDIVGGIEVVLGERD